MLPISRAQFDLFEQTHRAAMHDGCKLVTVTPGAIVHNIPKPIYTVGPTVYPCGYDPTGGTLDMGDSRVIDYSGTIRLPLGTPIDTLGGFIITIQAGQAVDPISLRLAAPPERGHTAITCRVQSVTDKAF